jgi:hypothetical protein
MKRGIQRWVPRFRFYEFEISRGRLAHTSPRRYFRDCAAPRDACLPVLRSVLPPTLRALHVTLLLVFASAFNMNADRRIVDTAVAGNAASESVHGFAGYDDESGMSDGTSYRQTRGWMRYALHTYDDTEVTVHCTFAPTDSVPRSFDIIVEDSLIATRVFPARPGMPQAGASTVVEIPVPFAVTRGKTYIAVVIRARGGITPALRVIRTIQDHNEVALLQNPSGVAR